MTENGVPLSEAEIAAAAGLDPKDPRYEQAVFGAEVRDFIDNHPIGRYLIDRARIDIESAKEELLTVDPQDAIKIREIQSRANTAENVRQWLSEAIEAGRAADTSLQHERDEHG